MKVSSREYVVNRVAKVIQKEGPLRKDRQVEVVFEAFEALRRLRRRKQVKLH